MNQFFISDHHFGHKNILKFSPERGGSNIEEHSEWLVEQHNSVVRPKDLVWVLGDVCFDPTHMNYLNLMNGTKKLIMGNHDEFHLDTYKSFFESIDGLRKKYKMWMSHAPIHRDHLRGLPNIHGHLHHNTVKEWCPDTCKNIDDPNYLNVSVERLNGVPISLEEVRAYFK